MTLTTPLCELTDEELSSWLQLSIKDLKAASEEMPNSEWHEACFAAVVSFATETCIREMENEVKH